jgi:hypothetical protein
MSFIVTATSITCPKLDGLDPITIHLDKLAKNEIRVAEVAIVNSSTAPELLAFFNQSWSEVNDLLSVVRYQKRMAETRLKNIKNQKLLDEVPGIIKERKLSSSKDIRDAILESYPECQELQEKIHQFECVVSILETKSEKFVNAFTSVKKLYGSGNSLPIRFVPSGDSGDKTVEETANIRNRSGFGKPSY